MNSKTEEVRKAYAATALTLLENESTSCCDTSCCDTPFGSASYQTDDAPASALGASLGCGNPTAVAELKEGETVLDLGSGGGLDVLLSAKRVGPSGKAIGLDMTDEMLQLARSHQDQSGLKNVEFVKGHIEDIPLPDSSIDVVISNCVINLSADKGKVFDQISRVLKPGGRVAISDVVSSDELSPSEKMDRGSFVGCIAGALTISEYETHLLTRGFQSVSVETTNEVVDGMYSAIIRGRKT